MMYHIKKDGTNNRLLVLFHGTGGDAKEMIHFGTNLDKDASLLAIEGDVKQWGMNRYFIRNDDGSFDEDNLKLQTEKTYTTMMNLLKEYGFADKKITLIGYSNGANIIQSMLKTYVLDVDHVLLLHPSIVRADQPFVRQKEVEVLLTSGTNDPYISLDLFNQLKTSLSEAGMRVETINHPYGHALVQEEIIRAQQIIHS